MASWSKPLKIAGGVQSHKRRAYYSQMQMKASRTSSTRGLPRSGNCDQELQKQCRIGCDKRGRTGRTERRLKSERIAGHLLSRHTRPTHEHGQQCSCSRSAVPAAACQYCA